MPQFQKFLAVPRYARGKLWFSFSAARIIAAASFRGCTKRDHNFDNFPRGVEGNDVVPLLQAQALPAPVLMLWYAV